MKALIVGGVLLGAAVLVGPVQAAELDIAKCVFPSAPAVPDGSTASEEEMITASGAVKAYVAENDKGLACLEASRQALGEEPMTEEQTTSFTNAYNSAVDAAHQVGNSWNEAVRAYKAKNPG
jgi:hypothetical protein